MTDIKNVGEDFKGEFSDGKGWVRRTLLAKEDIEDGAAPNVLWGKKREGSPKTFAKNLHLLTALKGLKGSTAADAVQEMMLSRGEESLRMARGEAARAIQKSLDKIRANKVDPKWYRRLMREGVSRTNEKTVGHLSAVALFFNVELEDLWDDDLVNRLNLERATDKEVPKPSIHVLYAKKIESLLDSGDYDFLKPLIDSLDSEMRRKKKKK